MFPLRKDYTRRLMQEVGFQRIDTFGDFKETFREPDPDFYVHIAEKTYDTIDHADHPMSENAVGENQ